MQQKIIWFVLFLVSASFSYYWFIIRDADAMALNELEYNDELLTGDVTQTTEVYARLEKKWIGSSQHIRDLQIVFEELNNKLDQEIKSTKDRFQDIEGDLADHTRKQNKKNEELDDTIDQNHRDLKNSIKNVKRDIKTVQKKRIEPLETQIKAVALNSARLDSLFNLDDIKKDMDKARKKEQ